MPRKSPPEAVEIWPSEYATSRQYEAKGEYVSGTARTDAETRAIKCAQCGAPIEDAGAINACWFCGSDNFYGRVLT